MTIDAARYMLHEIKHIWEHGNTDNFRFVQYCAASMNDLSYEMVFEMEGIPADLEHMFNELENDIMDQYEYLLKGGH